MRYSILTLVGVSAILALCIAFSAFSQDRTIEASQDGTIEAERYYPDPSDLFPATPIEPDNARAPYPGRQRTLEVDEVIADKIVLSSKDLFIVITAQGNNPGILMQHRSGYAQHLYFGRDGKAVIGVRAPGQKYFSSAIWANENTGILQMRGPRGVYTMQPKNIYQKAQ